MNLICPITSKKIVGVGDDSDILPRFVIKGPMGCLEPVL